MKSREKRRQRIRRLSDQGFEALDSHDLGRAIKIGKRLRKKRYSAAFEILGLAYEKQGKRRKAISILEEGVEKAPVVWLLWELLGNYYSDSGKYKKALRAYQSALNCPSVDEAFVGYNIAIVLGRRNRPADALEYVNRVLTFEIDNVTLEISARATKVSLLSELARHEEANALADEILEQQANYQARAEDTNALSVVETQLAEVLWKGKNDKPAALKFLWRAISHDKSNEEAAHHIRHLRNEKSQESKLFYVLVEGVWHEPLDGLDNPGFYASYHVVADGESEAMKFLKKFEPPPVRRSLIMHECEQLNDWPDKPKGVYKTFPYGFFSQDEDENDANHDN